MLSLMGQTSKIRAIAQNFSLVSMKRCVKSKDNLAFILYFQTELYVHAALIAIRLLFLMLSLASSLSDVLCFTTLTQTVQPPLIY